MSEQESTNQPTEDLNGSHLGNEAVAGQSNQAASSDGVTHEAAQQEEDPYEGAVPPGYDWPTHGGYLGCLLSLIVSVLIGGFLGSTLFATLRVLRLVPGIVAILLTVAFFIVVIVALGRLGWVLGKRLYREYPKPRGKSWGEDDDFTDDEATETTDKPAQLDIAGATLHDTVRAEPRPTDDEAAPHLSASASPRTTPADEG